MPVVLLLDQLTERRSRQEHTLTRLALKYRNAASADRLHLALAFGAARRLHNDTLVAVQSLAQRRHTSCL
jgi:hypothetical protein